MNRKSGKSFKRIVFSCSICGNKTVHQLPKGKFSWFFAQRMNKHSCCAKHIRILPEPKVIAPEGVQVKFSGSHVEVYNPQMVNGDILVRYFDVDGYDERLELCSGDTGIVRGGWSNGKNA